MSEGKNVYQFEMLADQFYRQTGIMAPGKDVHPAMFQPPFPERLAKWHEWLEKRATNENTGGTSDA